MTCSWVTLHPHLLRIKYYSRFADSSGSLYTTYHPKVPSCLPHRLAWFSGHFCGQQQQQKLFLKPVWTYWSLESVTPNIWERLEMNTSQIYELDMVSSNVCYSVWVLLCVILCPLRSASISSENDLTSLNSKTDMEYPFGKQCPE